MKNKLNSNIYVKSIYVTMYMRCGIAMLFTCILVLSRSVAREGAHVKHESLEQTARYWVGQDKQGRYMRERISKRFSLTHLRGAS
jgi:hypothetical protein